MEERNTVTPEELNARMIDLDSKIYRIESKREDQIKSMYKAASFII